MAKSPHQINGNFTDKNIISLDQFSSSDIGFLFSYIPKMKAIAQEKVSSSILAGYIASLFFYEPSSRTFGSFSSAVKRLGGQTIAYQDAIRVSSASKGESLSDTIKTIQNYCDVIIIRTANAGEAQKAAEAAFFVPVINAGDGKGEHPTQALLDLYTIYEKHKRLDNLKIVFGGDMLNGRTVHSLLRGLALYKENTAYLLSPDELRLSPVDYDEFSKRGITLIEITSEKDLPQDADVWYWTRVQKERFLNTASYEKVKNKFIINKKLLDNYGNNKLMIMHPLPRIGEITEEIDTDPRAFYFTQMQNGVYVRMALMALVLGRLH